MAGSRSEIVYGGYTHEWKNLNENTKFPYLREQFFAIPTSVVQEHTTMGQFAHVLNLLQWTPTSHDIGEQTLNDLKDVLDRCKESMEAAINSSGSGDKAVIDVVAQS